MPASNAQTRVRTSTSRGILAIVAATTLFATMAQARATWTPDTLPLRLEAIGPAISSSGFFPPTLCTGTSFLTSDPQPVTRAIDFALGACSDAPIYESSSTTAVVVFSATITPPFSAIVEAGTNAAFSIDSSGFPVYECDLPPVPPSAISPCVLTAVQVTDTTSFWTFVDDTGSLEFTLEADAPFAVIPEPGFSVGLPGAVAALATHARRRFRKKSPRAAHRADAPLDSAVA